MSLKNDIEMVKDELNSEEKFFEKAVMTERFVKKYKKALIGAVVAVVVVVGANIAYEINNQNRIDSANEALAQLQVNPKNEVALARMDSLSPQMHDLWLYFRAITSQNVDMLKKLQTSKTDIVDDLAKYEYAQATNNLKKLEAYSTTQNAIYKDLAIVQSAVILMKEGKIEESHEMLSSITADSPLAKVANVLLHYGVK